MAIISGILLWIFLSYLGLFFLSQPGWVDSRTVFSISAFISIMYIFVKLDPVRAKDNQDDVQGKDSKNVEK